MARQESLESYNKWEPLERKIEPGTITEVHHTHYKISLKGGKGILDDRDGYYKIIFGLKDHPQFIGSQVGIDYRLSRTYKSIKKNKNQASMETPTRNQRKEF